MKSGVVGLALLLLLCVRMRSEDDKLILEALDWLSNGIPAVEVASHFGISVRTLQSWRRMYGSRQEARIGRIRRLQETQKHLERALASARSDLLALQSGLKENLTPTKARTLVKHLQQEHGLSERAACDVLGVPRSTVRYQPQRDDNPIKEQLVKLMNCYPDYGYRRLTKQLRECGIHVNHKRVLRLCREIRSEQGQQE